MSIDKSLNIYEKFLHSIITIDRLINYFNMPMHLSSFYEKLAGHYIHPRYWVLINSMREVNFSIIVENNSSMTNISNDSLKYKKVFTDLTRMLDILSSVQYNGIDIYTTNMINAKKQVYARYPYFTGSLFKNINNQDDLEHIFCFKPKGFNNLYNTMEAIIEESKLYNNYKIVFIPINNNEYNYTILYEILNKVDYSNIHFLLWINPCVYKYKNSSFIIDNLLSLNILNSCTVLEDYKVCRKRVFKTHTESFRYSRGDHEIIKICTPVFNFLKYIHKYNFPILEHCFESKQTRNLMDMLKINNEFALSKVKNYLQKNKKTNKHINNSTNTQRCNIM
mgnify:FL=1|jgi:hypothetical protein